MGIKDKVEKMASSFWTGATGILVRDTDVIREPGYARPVMIYSEGEEGQAIKGVSTEEFWLNPPYGRPRNIDFNALLQFERSEWIQICLDCIIDGVVSAEWDIVPRIEGEENKKEIEECKEWIKGWKSEESFEDCLAAMLPDLLLYDSGVIVKNFSMDKWDEDGNLILDDENYGVVDLSARDGRSFMIEASPVGSRWRRFWQYSWLNPGGMPTRFELDEVLYFRMRPSSRGLYGISRLEIIQNIVNYLIDAAEQGSKVLENGLFVGGQIDHPDIKDIEELKRKAMEYKSALRGAKKSGKWLITGGNVEIKTFPFSQQQMQWLDGQRWYAKLVMAMFKIAPSEIGFTEDLNRATGLQQQNIHKSRALRPVMRVVERTLNKGLIWKMYPDVSFKFIESLDYEDEMKQAQIDNTYLQAGKVTVNELRERDGQDKFEDEIFDMPLAHISYQNKLQEEAAQRQQQQQQQSQSSSIFGDWNPFSDDSTDDEEGDEEQEKETGSFDDEFGKVWTEEAREAALEARRRKGKKGDDEVGTGRKGKAWDDADKVAKQYGVKPEHVYVSTSEEKKKIYEGGAMKLITEYPGVMDEVNKWTRIVSVEGKTSIKEFKKDGKYVPERQQLHDKIVEKYAKPKKAKTGDKTLMLFGGASGSGKGGLAKMMGDRFEEFAYLNNDDIKGELPGYNGKNSAYYHEECRDIVNAIKDRLLKDESNIIVDGTMKDFEKTKKMIEQYKKKGYRVEMMGTNLPLDKVIDRNIGRLVGEGEEGRYVPLGMVIETAEQANINMFELLKFVDKGAIYSTDVGRGKPYELIKEKEA